MTENPHIKRLMQELEAGETEGTVLQDLYAEEKGFSEGFATRTTEAAFDSKSESFTENLTKAFRWVAFLGAAAAVALLILTWTANDSLTTDDIAGVSTLALTDDVIDNLY